MGITFFLHGAQPGPFPAEVHAVQYTRSEPGEYRTAGLDEIAPFPVLGALRTIAVAGLRDVEIDQFDGDLLHVIGVQPAQYTRQ